MPTLANLGLVVAVGASLASAEAPRFLAPTQDIVLWPSTTSGCAKSPLQRLGANSPYSSGPNVYGITTDVPSQCIVDQAAYVSRHGSRYPDEGAYNGWKDFESRVRAANFTASGALAFLPNWRTVLTNPARQIAMQSPTGYKEAFDMGYQLRTRYSGLYNEGDDFYVWSNNYTRVLQTATNFVNGFLGSEQARTLGKVVSVTSRNFASAVGNSLGPSDSCPNFRDASGGAQKSTWDDIWQPQLQERLQKLINGNLNLTRGDCDQMAYLCGFESQITGRVSPFCNVLTDVELRSYGYSNDLRYYYGVGPGTELPPKMMTPFLNSLMANFQQGPGIEGVAADGVSKFKVPKLLMAFLNDGQLTELQSVTGIFDEEAPLDPRSRNDRRLWNGSRFTTMRGTVAFERLTCGGSSYVRILLNDQVYPIAKCQNGPGRSCPLETYVNMTKERLAKQGNWMQNCNVTVDGVSEDAKGATFFTDLSQPHLQILSA